MKTEKLGYRHSNKQKIRVFDTVWIEFFWVYCYSKDPGYYICQIFQGLRLFEGLRLLFWPIFPVSMLIWGSTLIRKSRVLFVTWSKTSQFLGFLWFFKVSLEFHSVPKYLNRVNNPGVYGNQNHAKKWILYIKLILPVGFDCPNIYSFMLMFEEIGSLET